MIRSCMSACLAATSLASTGCVTAAKQAYYGVTGASVGFYELSVVEPEVLAGYGSVRVEPFVNDLGEHVPDKVIAAVNRLAPQEIADAAQFDGSGRTLAVSGTIIHFTGKSALSGAIGSVIGGGEDCVCRVRLADGETGQLVGEAVCWATVKSAVRRGSREVGTGVGKAVAEWLEKRMPGAEEDTGD